MKRGASVMKIATYNILKGGAERVHWLKLIEEHAVDLLLVQETYHHKEHLPSNRYPLAGQQAAWQMVKQNGWGSAGYSPSRSVEGIGVSGFAGWVVGAEIEGAKWQAGLAESLLVFSIHA